MASEKQATLLSEYIEFFSTGNLEAYRRAQKTWVTDKSPKVENILGFVELYRDPYGVRGECESVVCISDRYETRRLKALVDDATKFIRLLPWAVAGDNDGKGPFEASLFQAPDLTIVHSRYMCHTVILMVLLTILALAFCTSCVWEALNLPNVSLTQHFGMEG